MEMRNKNYYEDKIRAFDAKIEAQKIAFSPMTFQAIRALIELGLLQKISDAGDNGISIKELAEDSGISEYGVGVLVEMALGMGVIKINSMSDEEADGKSGLGCLVLGKIGWFLLEDECTKVNFNFTNDICYRGAYNLIDSVKNGKPEGLKVFGDKWTTVYEAL